MVQELGHRQPSTSPPEEARPPLRVRTRPWNRLPALLEPFRAEHNRILKERARLSYVALRRSSTTPYQTFLYQSTLDDLRIKMEELECSIAEALYANMEAMVDECLEQSVLRHLARSRETMVEIPPNPLSKKEARMLLYRMYRGGSFHPLVFPRDVANEFYRALSSRIDREGMRGKEIAAQVRRLVLRLRYDLDRSIQMRLEASEYLEPLGYVRWTWRRGKVVRRLAYAPKDMVKDATRVSITLDAAIRASKALSRPRRAGARASLI